MTHVEKYLIEPGTGQSAVPHMEEHRERMLANRWREFRMSEVPTAMQFAVVYYLNAVQDTMFEALHAHPGDDVVGLDIGDGWRARRIDLGLHWKRHVEFFRVGTPQTGYVVEGSLNMERTRRPVGQRLSFTEMMGHYDEKVALLKANGVSEAYDPANVKRLDEVKVYPFDGYDDYDSRHALLRKLREGTYADITFEVNPEKSKDVSSLPEEMRGEYDKFMVGTAGRTPSPEGAMEALALLHRFLGLVNAGKLAKELEVHAGCTYYTPEKGIVSLMKATRATLERVADTYPPKAFIGLLGGLWREAACDDVIAFLPQIVEAADALVEMGHVSPEQRFECNDGRTVVYAQENEDDRRMFVEHDEGRSLVVTTKGDHVSVRAVNFETGVMGRTIIDFDMEDGMLKNINRATGIKDGIMSTLVRTLVDCSSTHCHVVSDVGRKTAPSPKM